MKKKVKAKKLSTQEKVPIQAEEGNHRYICEITDLKELNALGCHYIMTANHRHITRIITRSMRWLTVKQDGQFMTKDQERARKRIDRLLNESNDNINRNLNIHILLNVDPREHPSNEEHFDESYIKKLIQVGADVRFLERESRMKLVLQDNEVYISFAHESTQVISIGYHYVGESKDDGLCRFLADEFDRLFDRAQKLALKNDKIVLASSKWERIKKAFKLTLREIVIIIISSAISCLLAIVPYFIKNI